MENNTNNNLLSEHAVRQKPLIKRDSIAHPTPDAKLLENEKIILKIHKLLDSLARHFPQMTLGILNKNLTLELIDGTGLSEIDLTVPVDNSLSAEIRWPTFDAEAIERLKHAFNGESISCEVKSSDQVYSVTTVPLSGLEDDLSEVLCVIQNVTDRKRMEEGLLSALEREKELGELKSRFVTMASHEFRTPLTTILASTFVLENYTGEDYDKEKKIYTNRIKRSVNNLTTILNEFLSLEKLEENKVRVHHAEVNIPEYVQDLIDELELIKRAGQIIEYNHQGRSIAHLDHHILWSIASNLISNAFKYSKPGDHIQVTSKVENDTVILIVSDPGIGIPPDEQKYIFGRFYRARNVTNIEGTGLGLHIVQKYVHLINGDIIFKSLLNVGTTFTVTLPAGLASRDTESEH